MKKLIKADPPRCCPHGGTGPQWAICSCPGRPSSPRGPGHVAQDNKKLSGKTNMARLLREGRELKVFSIRESDLADFKSYRSPRLGILRRPRPPGRCCPATPALWRGAVLPSAGVVFFWRAGEGEHSDHRGIGEADGGGGKEPCRPSAGTGPGQQEAVRQDKHGPPAPGGPGAEGR